MDDGQRLTWQPGVGDILDVAHGANRKNLRLLEQAITTNPDPPPLTVGYLFAAVALVGIPLLVGVVLSVVAIWLLLRWLLT